MGRDYELEEKFYTYLESLGVNDAQNALLPAMDIVRGKEQDCEEDYDPEDFIFASKVDNG